MDKMNKYLFSVAIIILFTACFMASMWYATNVPHLDDYDQVLGFLSAYENSTDLWQKILLLFSERNEHRTTVFHFFGLLDYSIFGTVSFKHLIFVINFFYFGIVWVLYKIFTTLDVDRRHLIPLVLLLAVPCWAVLNWPAAGLNYCPTIFFSITSFYLLNKNSKRSFIGATLCAILSLCSSGAGLLVFLAALPFFIKRGNRVQSIIWWSTFVLCTVLYFYGYQPANEGGNSLAYIVESPHVFIANIFVFYGSIFQSAFGQHYIWSVLFGGVFLSLAGLVGYRYRYKILDHPLLFSGILLGLALGLASATMRSYLGLGVTAAFRYRLFQFILPIFLYFVYLKFSEKRSSYIYWVVGLSIFLFGLRWEDNLNYLKQFNNRLTYGLYGYKVTNSVKYLPIKKPERIRNTLEQAQKKGIYDLANIEVSPKLYDHLSGGEPNHPIRFIKYKEKDTGDYYMLQGWVFLKFNPNDNLSAIIKLQGDQGTYYLETGPLLYPRSLIQNARSGFTAIIDKNESRIPSGTYQVALVLKHSIKGVQAQHVLKKKITIN